MPRKIFQDKYDKDGIVVKWAGIGDVYSIGGWCADMEEGDVCYECSPDFEQTWSHDQMIITAEKSIVGYSIGIDCTLTEENGYAKPYEKEYKVFDFVVDCGESSEKLSKILLNQLIKYACFRNCSFISFVKRENKFDSFYKLVGSLFKPSDRFEAQGKILFRLCPDPLTDEELLLIPRESDFLSREFMAYLDADGFKVNENRFYFEKDGNILISVERKTGVVTFNENVIDGFNVPFQLDSYRNLAIVSHLANCYRTGDIKPSERVYINKLLCSRGDMNFTIELIYRNNAMCHYNKFSEYASDKLFNFFKLQYCLHKNKIDFLYTRCSYYNWEVSAKETEMQSSSIKTLIRNHKAFAELEDTSIKAKHESHERFLVMCDKITNIHRFQFEMGNSFGGVKKLLIRFHEDEIIIQENSANKKLPNPHVTDKTFIQELKTSLRGLHFENWKPKYEGKPSLDSQPWRVSFSTFQGENFEFCGLNAYPQNWIFLLDLLDEISNLMVEEEE